jgi:hypothetical protein
MKTTLGIILGVILGFLVLMAIVALLVFMYIIPAVSQTSITSFPAPSITYSPAPNSATPVPTVSKPSPTTTTSTGNDVNFVLNINSVSGTDFSRRISAELINTGTNNAQNTWVKVEVFSGGNKIKIKGEDFLRKDIGTLKAGMSTIQQVTLSFSPFDAAKLLLNGAAFNLTICSDQKTQTFSYDYKP